VPTDGVTAEHGIGSFLGDLLQPHVVPGLGVRPLRDPELIGLGGRDYPMMSTATVAGSRGASVSRKNAIPSSIA
jgi:hypothetical protein